MDEVCSEIPKIACVCPWLAACASLRSALRLCAPFVRIRRARHEAQSLLTAQDGPVQNPSLSACTSPLTDAAYSVAVIGVKGAPAES